MLTSGSSGAMAPVPHEKERGNERERHKGENDEDDQEHEGGMGFGCRHGAVTSKEQGAGRHIAVGQAFLLRVRLAKGLSRREETIADVFVQLVNGKDCAHTAMSVVCPRALTLFTDHSPIYINALTHL